MAIICDNNKNDAGINTDFLVPKLSTAKKMAAGLV